MTFLCLSHPPTHRLFHQSGCITSSVLNRVGSSWCISFSIYGEKVKSHDKHKHNVFVIDTVLISTQGAAHGAKQRAQCLRCPAKENLRKMKQSIEKLQKGMILELFFSLNQSNFQTNKKNANCTQNLQSRFWPC